MAVLVKDADFHIDCSPESSAGTLREFESHFPNIAVEATGREAPFYRAAGFSIGTGTLYSVAANCRFQRRQPDVKDHVAGEFALFVTTSGVHEVSEPGRRTSVAPGSVTLLDGSRDFSVTREGVGSGVSFVISREVILRRHPHLERYSSRIFHPDDPGTHMMRDIVLNGLKNASKLDELQRSALASTIVASLGLPKRSRSEAEWRVEKAISYILAHLGDPHLNALAVARAQFISRRSLDELFFRVIGRPVAAEIMDRRLTRAGEDLCNPSLAGQSIGSIAYSIGFEHPAHFTRAFRRRFGVVPSVWQRGDNCHRS